MICSSSSPGLPSLVCLIAVLGTVAACSGSSDNAPTGKQSDAGPELVLDSGADTGSPDTGPHDTDAGACVDIVISAADLACTSDQDCSATIPSEQVCPGYDEYDLCYSAAANVAAADRIAQQLASIPQGHDAGYLGGCDIEAEPVHCLSGQCVVCGAGSTVAGCATTE